MISGFIVATLGIVAYSLWIRRDTWWTRWEAGASLALILEGCALVLMSPWAGAAIGSVLYRGLGVWNMQQLLGHLCLILAVSANIHHMLVRLADPDQVRSIIRRQVMVPAWLGLAVMVPAFLSSGQQYLADFFAAASTESLRTVYELVGCALMLYLCGYVSRLMLALRHDPRARTTIDLYLVSMAFGAAACVAVVASAWVDFDDAGPVIWACLCLAVGIFAYGSARSWQAKNSWFTSGGSTPIVAQ